MTMDCCASIAIDGYCWRTLVNGSSQGMEEGCKTFYFALWGVIGSIFCIAGLIGNLLSFCAFQKDKRGSTSTLLQCLAISDFLLLLMVFITDAMPYTCGYTGTCKNIWEVWPYIRYVWILTPITHMCSVWYVVLVAINRFWAVCKPHSMVTVWSLKRGILYITMVFLLSVIFNIPRIFEYEITQILKLNTTDQFHLIEQKTNFGSHNAYKTGYKMLLVNIMLFLMPILLLICLTCRIIENIKVRKQSFDRTSSMNRASQEITFVLTVVVVVSIVCQSPLCIFHFVRYTATYRCGDVIFYLDNISKIFVNINSSVNFIIYCLFSKKFRRLLVKSVSCKQNSKQRQNGSPNENGTPNSFRGVSVFYDKNKANAINILEGDNHIMEETGSKDI